MRVSHEFINPVNFAGAFSYIDPGRIRWRLTVGFFSIPSLLQLITFLLLPEIPPEIPRFLFENGNERVAEKVE